MPTGACGKRRRHTWSRNRRRGDLYSASFERTLGVWDQGLQGPTRQALRFRIVVAEQGGIMSLG
jgi:hypothetical protein